MSSPVRLEQPLSEIVGARPGAARVLRGYGLDFCTGGEKSLGEACAGCALDPQEVRRALISARAEPDDVHVWTDRSLIELIRHIRERYHDRHRLDLPYLADLAHTVERRHSARAGCPHGLKDHLDRMREELEGHLDEEEQIVFPLIENGARLGVAAGSFAGARHEHEEFLEALRVTRRLTGDFERPIHPCRTWRVLYDGLIDLERDVMNHIHLENNVLFPRAAAQGLI